MEFAQGRPNGSKTAKVMCDVSSYFQIRSYFRNGLERAPEGYKSFDAGVANKYVIDPHRQLPRVAQDLGSRLCSSPN
jgi:hypothetical protein